MRLHTVLLGMTGAWFAVVSATDPSTQVPSLSSSRTIEGLPAQPQAVPIPAGRKVFYEMNNVPWLEFSPGLRRRTVAGEAVTFSMIELDPKLVKGVPPSKAHHHDYEQFLWGVAAPSISTSADRRGLSVQTL